MTCCSTGSTHDATKAKRSGLPNTLASMTPRLAARLDHGDSKTAPLALRSLRGLALVLFAALRRCSRRGCTQGDLLRTSLC